MNQILCGPLFIIGECVCVGGLFGDGMMDYGLNVTITGFIDFNTG